MTSTKNRSSVLLLFDFNLLVVIPFCDIPDEQFNFGFRIFWTYPLRGRREKRRKDLRVISVKMID